jgi:hypothetical protein
MDGFAVRAFKQTVRADLRQFIVQLNARSA